MNERLTLWFPLGLMVLLALLTFWLDRTVQEPFSRRDGGTRHDPDYWVENFLARRMGMDGLPLHTLAAVKMEHFPDDDTTRLTRPHFISMDKNRVPIHIEAQRGLISSNGEEIYFSRGVEIRKNAGNGKDWLTLTTEYLHITPDQDIARTDKAVTIKTPAGVITATGMELNNRTRMVKLLSRVKGHYEKPRS
jgi:lipopolysaccharide export system protein LptC